MSLEFFFGPARMTAFGTGALYWADQQLLCVSDLHFGKSERLARRGGSLLPPYETRATLERMDNDLERTQAKVVICLGDSFDDLAAADEMEEECRLWLSRLMAGRRWIWIAGNHDPGPVEIAGSHLAEFGIEGLVFRHEGGGSGFEVSGHFHPKASLAGRGSVPCFLIGKNRMILPAYGTYTGGLRVDDPVFDPVIGPNARAILTGERPLLIPRPRR